MGPHDTAEVILARVGEGKFNMTGGNWDSISDLAKDLVLRMLHVDPRQRIAASDVLRHRWILNREHLPTEQSLHYQQDPKQVKVR